jgi:hypothetical protein
MQRSRKSLFILRIIRIKYSICKKTNIFNVKAGGTYSNHNAFTDTIMPEKSGSGNERRMEVTKKIKSRKGEIKIK